MRRASLLDLCPVRPWGHCKSGVGGPCFKAFPLSHPSPSSLSYEKHQEFFISGRKPGALLGNSQHPFDASNDLSAFLRGVQLLEI